MKKIQTRSYATRTRLHVCRSYLAVFSGLVFFANWTPIRILVIIPLPESDSLRQVRERKLPSQSCETIIGKMGIIDVYNESKKTCTLIILMKFDKRAIHKPCVSWNYRQFFQLIHFQLDYLKNKWSYPSRRCISGESFSARYIFNLPWSYFNITWHMCSECFELTNVHNSYFKIDKIIAL